MRRWGPIAWLAATAAISACSKPEPSPPAATTPEATVAPASANGGRIVGRVQASGAAVVVLEPKGARTFAPQSEKPVMDQVSLTFGPDLLFVRTGQPAEFRDRKSVV